ncbi:MAG: ABC transporter substrate-binding protein [Telmatospirillum sp.]|nr:ABC transporter substrate-binding protein [Telmatospirillum sp.]
MAGLLPAGPAFAGRTTVDIGCLYPMTGRAALYGKDSVAAAEMAINEINAAGGAAGKQLRLFFADDQSKPAFASRIARQYIVENKVDFLCGGISSTVGLAVSKVSLEYKKIFIGTDHASSRLSIENFHRYYFRVSNSVYQSMAAGALYLARLRKETGWKTIAFIGPDYEYGHGMWDDLKENFAELGITYQVVGEYWPKLYEPDLTPYIAAIRKANPDIVINGQWDGDWIAFVRQANAYNLFERTHVFNFDTGGSYEVMEALKDEMPLGLVLSTRHNNNWPDTDLNRKFVNNFHALTGRYPSYSAHGAYAGMYAIAAAVNATGGTADTEALIRALEGLHLKLPKDPDGFESYIDPGTHQIVQVQAIGVVERNTDFPPATAMLGHWQVYPAEQLMPPRALLERRRQGHFGSTSPADGAGGR